jgi:outer membrane protein
MCFRLGLERSVKYLFLTFVATISFCQQGNVLTVERAVELALTNNPEIKNALLDVQRLEDQFAANFTRRFPSFNVFLLFGGLLTQPGVTYQQGVWGTYPATGPIPAKDTEVTAQTGIAGIAFAQVTEPLTQQIRIGYGLHQLRIGQQLTREQVRAKRQATANEVRRTYYQIVEISAATRALKANVQLYEETLREADSQATELAILESQHLQAKAQLERARYQQMQIEEPLETLKGKLNQLMGRAPDLEFSIVDQIASDTPVPDLSSSLSEALQSRPEIRQANLKIDQARYERKAKLAEYIPDISLALDYATTGHFQSLLPSDIFMVGLQLTWEPFDFGRKRHEAEEKKRVEEQARNTWEDAKRLVEIDVRSHWRKLAIARQHLTAASAAHDAAVEGLREVQVAYRDRAVLLKRVLEVQAGVEQSTAEEQSARSELRTAQADFEKAVGAEQ